MAALEAKVESYEKEIKQLQKALEKSDKYISELELKDGKTERLKDSLKSNSMNSNLENSSKPTFKFIRGDNQTFKNDLKIVKFSEKIESISRRSTSPKLGISHDKFYGSPSKAPPNVTPNKTQSSILPSNTISSFSERMKKSSYELFEKPCEPSTNTPIFENHHSNQSNSHSFLFSPMKRLRLDELPPSYPETKTSPPKILDMDTKKIIKTPSFTSNYQKTDEIEKKTEPVSYSTTEFNDCLQLLDKAEQKVQNRIVTGDTTLTRKPSFSSNQTQDKLLSYGDFEPTSTTPVSSLSLCSTLFGSSNNPTSLHHNLPSSSSSSSAILNNLSNQPFMIQNNISKNGDYLKKSPDRPSYSLNHIYPSFEQTNSTTSVYKSPPKQFGNESDKFIKLDGRSLFSVNGF